MWGYEGYGADEGYGAEEGQVAVRDGVEKLFRLRCLYKRNPLIGFKPNVWLVEWVKLALEGGKKDG